MALNGLVSYYVALYGLMWHKYVPITQKKFIKAQWAHYDIKLLFVWWCMALNGLKWPCIALCGLVYRIMWPCIALCGLVSHYVALYDLM